MQGLKYMVNTMFIIPQSRNTSENIKKKLMNVDFIFKILREMLNSFCFKQ